MSKIHDIEKRMRKEIRIKQCFEKDDRVIIQKSGSYKDKVLKHFLEHFGLPLQVQIKEKKESNTEQDKGDQNIKQVQTTSAEDQTTAFFTAISTRENNKEKRKRKATVLELFTTVSEDDLQHYALQHKLATQEKIQEEHTKKQNTVTAFIKEIQEKYPETKAALAKTVAQLQTINTKKQNKK